MFLVLTEGYGERLLLYKPGFLREPPAQMLAPIKRNHLPRHGRRIKDVANGPTDLPWRCWALEWHAGGLFRELLVRLPLVRQRRTRSDSVHADSGRKRESECLGQGPKTHFAECVSREMGSQRPYAFIQQIASGLWALGDLPPYVLPTTLVSRSPAHHTQTQRHC